jgi:CRISPR-associated protein Cas2
MVHAAQGEQRLEFQVHGRDWTPVDYDGITLMRRQTAPDYVPWQAAPQPTETGRIRRRRIHPGRDGLETTGSPPQVPQEEL